MAISKRSLLVGAVAAVAGYVTLRYAVPYAGSALSGGIDFEDIDNPPGFRRISGGNSSVSRMALVGLDDDQDDEMKDLVQQVRNDICLALFGAGQPVGGTVRIASFSDYNCPYCRVLTPILARMESDSAGAIRVSWHELPLLGDLSVLASKAALAAGRQGAYVAFHKRLMRAAFLKTPEYIQRLAGELGIDGDQLAADMQSPGVIGEIRQSIALSKVFGFIGTPVLVVGNTVVQGQISKADLTRLIKRERADGPARACLQRRDGVTPIRPNNDSWGKRRVGNLSPFG